MDLPPPPPPSRHRLRAWSSRTWRTFRRWPTWLQIIVWVFYGWLVLIPLWLLDRAHGTQTLLVEGREGRRAGARPLLDRYAETWGSVCLRLALSGVLVGLVGAIASKRFPCSSALWLPFAVAFAAEAAGLVIAVRRRALGVLLVSALPLLAIPASGPSPPTAYIVLVLAVWILLPPFLLVLGVLRRAEPRRQRNLALVGTLVAFPAAVANLFAFASTFINC